MSNKGLPITKIWTHYIDKYLKYLFTGKVLKFREAVVSKESLNENGIIGYASNINKGIIRSYNEDRIVSILNLSLSKNKILEENASWLLVSFFAIFDGHGGNSVSEWLAENLHNYIINQSSFPLNPRDAILQGFKDAEDNLLVKLINGSLQTTKPKTSKQSENNKKHDVAGSCALVCMIINKECYIANVGDSRALISTVNISRNYTLTTDHKPDDPTEKDRIEKKRWKTTREFTI